MSNTQDSLAWQPESEVPHLVNNKPCSTREDPSFNLPIDRHYIDARSTLRRHTSNAANMSRGNESGMDFEYQNKTGPLDARSPFAQLSQNTQRFGASTPSKQRTSLATMQSCSDADDGTGGQSAFSSPFKNAANLQPSPARKALPPTPVSAFNALYNTPRSKAIDFDDSSAGETPKSPERSDNDATPDHSRLDLRGALNNHEASTLPTMPGAERASPTKEKTRPDTLRRDSWLGASWGKFSTLR